MFKKTSIPYLLIVFRASLIPVMPLIGYFYGAKAGVFLALLLFLGLMSDFFDGVIARRLNSATDKLRRLDSQTDAVFWLATLFTIYLLHAELIISIWPMITILVLTEICCYLISFIKFHRETCTHSYLSKLWGLSLFISLGTMLAHGIAGIAWYICFTIGLISQLEVIAILLILPHWSRDVKTFFYALKIRKGK